MANCRFEDNYTDFGLLGKFNTPILKCDPPSTNAIWGMGAMGSVGSVVEMGNAGVPAQEMKTGSIAKAPVFETCNGDEIDMGLTCNKMPECKTEEDKNQPIKGLFGEILGYMLKTTCTNPSVRVKKQY